MKEWRHTAGFLLFAAAFAHDAAYQFTLGGYPLDDSIAATTAAAALAFFAWWARPERFKRHGKKGL